MENYYSMMKKEEPITSITPVGDNFDQQQYHLQYENNNTNSTFIATHNQNDANFFNHKAFIDYYNCKSK